MGHRREDEREAVEFILDGSAPEPWDRYDADTRWRLEEDEGNYEDDLVETFDRRRDRIRQERVGGR